MADYTLKVCLLGDAAVGKTSLVYRFIENRFSKDFKTTLGVNLLKKAVEMDDKNISVQIWDLGGQDAYKNLRKLYLEGAQGALLVFDVTSQSSFDNLGDWLTSLYDVRGEKIPLILIGNKIDLEQNRVVKEEKVKEFAKGKNMEYLFTSAKTGQEVENAFRQLIKKIVDSFEE